MAIRLPAASRNAMVAALVDLLAAGGTIQVRTGAQPAAAGDAASGTLLATINLAAPAFGPPSAGTSTLDADPALTGTGVSDGDAGWFRARDSGAATVMDGSVSESGGGGDLIVATATVTVGLTVRITAGTVTMPAE